MDARQTEKFAFALNSPLPNSFTPSCARRIRPAFTIASTSIAALTSSLPASIAVCTLSRLISLSLSAKGVLRKPRFGRRRCSGIWPPSKPLMRTPVRAVWPLPPRPPVLPIPEPMPRPMRVRFLREPALSAIWLSFISRPRSLNAVSARACRARERLLLLAHHADEMLHLADHAVRRRVIRQFAHAPDLVQTEADQRLALIEVLAQRARDLLDLDGLCFGHELLRGRFRLAAFATTRLQRGHLDVAARRDRTRRVLVLERIEGRAHHVVWIGRAERLRHDVLHAEGLEHGAHRAAGDDAGSRRGRAQEHLAGTVTACDVVVQRAAFAQRRAGQAALGGFGRLAGRLRRLARLAKNEGSAAHLVVDLHKR